MPAGVDPLSVTRHEYLRATACRDGTLILLLGLKQEGRVENRNFALELHSRFRKSKRTSFPWLAKAEDRRTISSWSAHSATPGAMVHHDDLIIPYAVADTSTAIAIVSLAELLSHLTGK